MKDRNWLKLDRYALFDIAREFDLSAAEVVVLFALVALADFRSQGWKGTITELTEHTPCNRSTVRRAYDRLKQLNLVSEVRPFVQNSVGSVRVDCYERLVLESRRKGRDQTVPRSGDRAHLASESGADRSRNDEGSANHQEFRDLERDRGEGGVGEPPRCPQCGKPMRDASFGLGCECPF